MYGAAAFVTLCVANLGEELAGLLGCGEQDPTFFKCLADGGEAVGGAVCVVCGRGGRRYGAIVGAAQGAARKDVGRGEARRLFDAVQEKNFVGGGNEENAGWFVSGIMEMSGRVVEVPRARPGHCGRLW